MRQLLLLALLLPIGGCKGKSVPDTGPCQRAQLEFWGADPPGSRPQETMACRELYRHASCGEAWSAELKRADVAATSTELAFKELPDARRILKACATAYCAELGGKPMACKDPAPEDNAKQVASLMELDAAILNLELRDELLAAALARRARLFRFVVAPNLQKLFGSAEPDDAQVIKVELTADGGARLDGKVIDLEQLEAEVKKLGPAEQLRATIAADRKVEHGRVIHTLDLLRRSGIKKIAFAVTPL